VPSPELIVYLQFLFKFDKIQLSYRYFKLELESTREPVHREWLLRRIRESEQEYLNIMTQERERLARETANMEEALHKIRAKEANKKK
jgi:hypothetical protein